MLILKASHLLGARVRADIDMPGLDDHFIKSHELDATLAQRIPEDAIGRMITATVAPAEARQSI